MSGTDEAQQNKDRVEDGVVIPLDKIAPEDIGAATKVVDDWLRTFTDGYVTLDRLTTVLGSIPVIGNGMALVGLLSDLVRIIKNQAGQGVEKFLLWVSVGINLIGLIPAPPTMAAARMTLRPTLHLVKQKLRQSGGNIADTIVELLIRHLNDSIVGELDKYIEEGMRRLREILNNCADLTDKFVNAITGHLRMVIGQADVFTPTPPAAPQMRDPETETMMGRLLKSVTDHARRAGNGLKSVGNAVAKKGSGLLPTQFVGAVEQVIQALEAFKRDFRAQLAQLANAQTANSIMFLMQSLLQAVVAYKQNKRRNGNVSRLQGNEVDRQRPGNTVEHVPVNAPARGRGGCKNCPAPSGSPNSIDFVFGTESVSHTDFVLTAALPIEFTRTYCSDLDAMDDGPFGARWITAYTVRVDHATAGRSRREGQLSFIYRGADGRSHAYPVLAVGQSHHDAMEEVTLRRLSETLLVLDFGKPQPGGQPGDWREVYERVDTPVHQVAQRGPQHFRLVAQQARDGLSIGVRYDHVIAATGEQVISDIIAKRGTEVLAHVGTRPDAQSGLIESMWEIQSGQLVRPLARYTHDDQRDLNAAQDENGASWNYSYAHHLLTRYTDRTGRGNNILYDGTSPQARAVREWTDDGTYAVELEWAKTIRLTYVTDAQGGETRHYYDIDGYTYRIIHPDGSEEWFFRDDAANLTSHLHADGSADDYAYDAHGNLMTHTRADGSQVHFAYDAQHRLSAIRDGEGGVWKRDYDSAGHLSEESDPLGHITEYSYNPAGQIVGITDAKGGRKTLSYAPNGQLASYTDCSGQTTRWQYDPRGRLVAAIDAEGQATRYGYAAVPEDLAGPNATTVTGLEEDAVSHPGQLEEITHPDGMREQLAHDAEGRLLSHTDALGRRTRYGYTRAGLIAQRHDAAGHTLRYRWDTLGRLSELVNENNAAYRFRYDPLGRLLEETGFDGKRTEYRYHASSGVLAEVVEAEQSTTLAFDPMGRLSTRSASGQSEQFVYDGNGRLIEARNADARLQWFYDAAGNLVREHQGDLELGTTAVWQHGYDELNQRISTRRPDGHQSQWLTYGSGHVHGLLLDGQDIVGFERDALHREIGREQANGLLQQQRYDPAGRLLEQSISPKITPLGADIAGSARGAGAGSYKNNSDRAGATSTSTTAGTSLQRRYQYDPAGQLIGIGDSRRGNLSYRYDPVGRLLQAHSRLGREHFAFDPAGNTLDGADNPEQHTRHLRHAPGVHGSHAVETADAAHQPPGAQPLQRLRVLDNLIKQYAGTHYQWDARGNLTERLHQGQKTTFAWDGYNRLIASTDARGQTTRYRYDPLGRRIAKSGEHSLTTFGWDGDTLAFESTQNVFAFNSDPHRAQGQHGEQGLGTSVHYIHEPGSFVPLVQIRQARAVQLQATPDIKALIQANGGRYDIEQDPLWSGESEPSASATFSPFTREEIAYYQCDHLGTPQELTDHAGQVAWSAHYKAWGEAKQAISEAGRKAGLSNPIRFQGQYWDEETGLHYNRYRYYDPQAGRFVSKDPIGLRGGLNVHGYAPNPIRWKDPLGLNCECDCEIDLPFARYPEAGQHILDAQAQGHPSVLTWDPNNASARRRQSLSGISKIPGKDLDEYPPASTAEGGSGASVRAINSSDNRGAGAFIGNKCRSFKNGTRFKINVKK